MKTKKCYKCGETDETKFTPSNFKLCRPCKSITDAEYRLRNKEILHQRRINKSGPKKCKCGETQEINFSPKNYTTCRACKIIEHKKYYTSEAKIKRKLSSKKWRENNEEFDKQRHSTYYTNNKEILSDKRKDYENENSEAISNRKRQYYIDNKTHILERTSNYQQLKILKVAENKILNGNNGDDWLLYVCEFKNEQEHFFKYGITSFDVATRFNQGKQYNSYKIIIHKEVYGSEDYIKGLERKILLETKNEIYYFPNETIFHGKSECRTKIDLDLVETLIN